ncbi:hypothetical protein QYF61_003034 [Mycteria americana]|uniref:Uncharacterized protein n=1 Tax=Mycteria americana TaxID=33587 RepID=A0AAN7NX87_MYCAM|nr:hypothetical protein QYF61_003034 [Mycteria americana]
MLSQLVSRAARRSPCCKRSVLRDISPWSDSFPLHPPSPHTLSPDKPTATTPATSEPNFASNNNKATEMVLFGGKFIRNPACQMHGSEKKLTGLLEGQEAGCDLDGLPPPPLPLPRLRGAAGWSLSITDKMSYD